MFPDNHTIDEVTYRPLDGGHTAISLKIAPKGQIGSTPKQLGEDVLSLNVTIRGSENLTIKETQIAAMKRAREIIDVFLESYQSA